MSSPPPKPPTYLEVVPEKIPTEIKQLKQWILWKPVWRVKKGGEGRWTKVPKSASGKATGTSLNWAITWATFDVAYEAFLKQKKDGIAGVGFILTNTSYSGVDFDHCINEKGEIRPDILDWIKKFNSYPEISASGSGIHILCKGKKREDQTLSKDINLDLEIYSGGESGGRYFTVTGHHVANCVTSINDAQPLIEELYNVTLGTKTSKKQARPPKSPLDDTVVNPKNPKLSLDEKIQLMRQPWQHILDPANPLKILEIREKTNRLGWLYYQGLFAEGVARGIKPEELFPLLSKSQEGFDPAEASQALASHAIPKPYRRETMAEYFPEKLFPEFYEYIDTDCFHICLMDVDALYYDLYDIKPKETKLRVNSNSMLADFLEHYTMFVATVDVLFAWNGSYYNGKVDKEIGEVLERICRRNFVRYNKNMKAEILDILLQRHQLPAGMQLDNNPNIVPFQNGYYHISTKRLEQPNPDDYCTNVFAWDYEPANQCTLFPKFITEVVPNEKERQLLLIYMAYCFTNRVDLQKMCMCPGTDSGNNGKSTLFEILLLIFGHDRLACSIPVQNLEDDRYKVGLRGKLLNIVPELPTKEGGITDEGSVKVLIDETISGRPLYGVPTTWHNTTKHIFGCNNIPNPPLGGSSAFYRRWLIIHFPMVFKNKDDGDFDPMIHRVADPFLLDKLKQELPGIITYLISFLPFLLELRLTDTEKLKQQWRSHSDTVLQYYEVCQKDDNAQVLCGELYTNYLSFCTRHKFSPSSQKHFGSILGHQGVSREQLGKQDPVSGYYIRNYYYVGLKPIEVKQTVIDMKQLKPVLLPPDEEEVMKPIKVDEIAEIKKSIDMEIVLAVGKWQNGADIDPHAIYVRMLEKQGVKVE